MLERLRKIQEAVFGTEIPRGILTCEEGTPWDQKTIFCRLDILESMNDEVKANIGKIQQKETDPSIQTATMVARATSLKTAASSKSTDVFKASATWAAEWDRAYVYWKNETQYLLG